MDHAVPTVHDMPMYIKTSLGERLTVIAVDSGVPGVNEGRKTHHDVIFVGTTRGRVLKLVNSARSGAEKEPLPVLVESLQVSFPRQFLNGKRGYQVYRLTKHIQIKPM